MSTQEITRRRSDSLDAVGTAMSLLCAVHCAALPLLLALLPLSAFGALADERLEWVLVIAAATIGIASLTLGFREHRSRRALAILAVGIALLLGGRMLEQASHANHENHAHEIHHENHTEENHASATHVSTHNEAPHQSFGLAVALMVCGGIGVALSHVVNRKLCLACRSCGVARRSENTTRAAQGCSHG